MLLPLLLCLLLCGCTRDPLAPMASPAESAELPAPAVSDQPAARDQATLWFRFGDEPFLAAQTRQMHHARTETHALALLRALVEGPDAASTELRGLFPQGTQVISVTKADQVMFVTLSSHIMKGFADEPASWRSQPDWASEVPLRRELAMQAIAATLTENCQVNTVVVLVEQKDTPTDSLRLRQGYYTLDGSTALAAPLHRDEALLLTPARTAEVILQYWQESDFARLYRYIARTDPATGTARPEEAAFIETMTGQRHLLHAQVRGGSVSADGCTAVFTVSGAWLDEGAELPFTGLVLRLTREKGLWRVGLSQLTGREALP